MSSAARKAFDESGKDVDRLLQLHAEVGGQGPGRRYGLEVLNKSAIVLITAFWEAYCEDLAAEALQHLVVHAGASGELPIPLRRQIASELTRDPHDLAVWRLAGDGWREVLTARLDHLKKDRDRKLNTPKTANINDLFDQAIGVGTISAAWRVNGMSATAASNRLDHFVTLRGEIAHRGKALRSVRKTHVVEYYDLVKALASKTGGRVNSAMKTATGRPLW